MPESTKTNFGALVARTPRLRDHPGYPLNQEYLFEQLHIAGNGGTRELEFRLEAVGGDEKTRSGGE